MGDPLVIVSGAAFGLVLGGAIWLMGYLFWSLIKSEREELSDQPLHVVASLFCAQVGCEELAVQAVPFGELSVGLCERHYELLTDRKHQRVPVTESNGGDR